MRRRAMREIGGRIKFKKLWIKSITKTKKERERSMLILWFITESPSNIALLSYIYIYIYLCLVPHVPTFYNYLRRISTRRYVDFENTIRGENKLKKSPIMDKKENSLKPFFESWALAHYLYIIGIIGNVGMSKCNRDISCGSELFHIVSHKGRERCSTRKVRIKFFFFF